MLCNGSVYEQQRLKKVYFVEKDLTGHRGAARLKKRVVFSLCYGMCGVQLALCSSDWITETRCERKLQLPPPAKQHYLS